MAPFVSKWKENVLHGAADGYQGFVNKSNRVELIQYEKSTVKMSGLFFAKTLSTTVWHWKLWILRWFRDTLITLSNGFFIPSYSQKKYVRVARCNLHRTVSHCSQMHFNSHVSRYYCSLNGESSFTPVKGQAVPLHAWTRSEGSGSFSLSHFKTIGTWMW